MLKELVKHTKDCLLPTLATPFIVLAEVAMDCMIPFVTSKLVDDGINSGNMNNILIYGALLLAMAAVGLSCGVLSAFTATKGSTGFAKNLMNDMYTNIQNFSFLNINKFSHSSLITRLTTDVVNLRMSYQMITRIFVRCPAVLIMALVMSFTISPRLALIFFAVTPILGIGLFLMIKYAYPLFMKVFKSYDKMNAVVRENVTGMRVVKSYNTQSVEIAKFDDASGDIYNYFRKAERILVLNGPLMQFSMYLCMLLISWFGGKLIVQEELTTGGLMAIITYVMQILMSLMMFSMVLVMITMSKASAERIVEVLQEKSDVVNPENPVTEVVNGDIELKNVGFSYVKDENKLCMHNINISIKSGEMVGILGGTGSGKTTLVQLLPRLYDATVGEVFVGGVNVKDYDLKVLRDNVAMVLQKNVLFSGTLRENMQWGNPDATDAEIDEVLRISCAKEFVDKFPNGYDEHIEQAGANLSGGQKQRLCIARALLKNPKILIMDDSTSAVDTKTDKMIKSELRTTKADVTKLIIAQRINSVIDADKIIVLDNGRVNGVGTHEELMANNQIYQEVYKSQNKGGEKDE